MHTQIHTQLQILHMHHQSPIQPRARPERAQKFSQHKCTRTYPNTRNTHTTLARPPRLLTELRRPRRRRRPMPRKQRRRRLTRLLGMRRRSPKRRRKQQLLLRTVRRQHRQAKEEMLLQMLPSPKRRKQQLLPLMTRRRSLQQRRAGPSMPQSVPKGRLRPNPRWRRWCRILFRIAANCSLLVEFSFDSSKLLAAAL